MRPTPGTTPGRASRRSTCAATRRSWASAEALEQARVLRDGDQRGDRRVAGGAAPRALARALVAALLGVVALYEAKKRARGAARLPRPAGEGARRAARPRVGAPLLPRSASRPSSSTSSRTPTRCRCEIAELLAGDRPGALVVVGDAKQSIYRFRRAEVALFRRMSAERAAAPRPRRAAPHAELPLAAGDPALRQPRVRRADPGFRGRGPAGLRGRSSRRRASTDDAVGDRAALRGAPSHRARTCCGAKRAATRRASSRRAAAGGFTVRDPATGTSRGQPRGRRDGAGSAPHAGAPPRGGAGRGRAALHRRGRQVVLRPPGGARGAGRAARDRRPVRPGGAGGGAALVLLRRQRPRPRRLRPRRAVTSAARSTARSRALPRWVRPWRRSARCTSGARELTVPRAARASSTTRRASWPRSPARSAARRRSRTSRRSRLWRAARPRSACSRCAASSRLLQERIRTAREEPDLPATRPGDPDTVRILSIHRPRGWRRRSWCSTTCRRQPAPLRRHPALGPAQDRGRLPPRLPAARLGRAGEGATEHAPPPRAGGCCTSPAPGRATCW